MILCYLAKEEEEEEEETVTTEVFIENRVAWEICIDIFSSMSPLSAAKTKPAGLWLSGRALT